MIKLYTELGKAKLQNDIAAKSFNDCKYLLFCSIIESFMSCDRYLPLNMHQI